MSRRSWSAGSRVAGHGRVPRKPILTPILPATADVSHVGATSIPGCVTKGDLDVVIRGAMMPRRGPADIAVRRFATRHSRRPATRLSDSGGAMERGAREGNRVAGPVGGIVGGAVGGAVGGVNGVLGIDPGRSSCATPASGMSRRMSWGAMMPRRGPADIAVRRFATRPATADVSHVGATSIPGCVTKGDLDVVIRVQAAD
jgi:hypothetical protein